jgi:putative peptide zinc metalloprotease protein
MTMPYEDEKNRWRMRRVAAAIALIATIIVTGCSDTTRTASSDAEAAGSLPATSSIGAAHPDAAPRTSSTSSPDTMTLVSASPSADATVSPETSQPSATVSTTGSPTAATSADASSGADYTFTDTSLASSGGGGGSNHVQVINKNDGKRKLKADVQLNRIPGPRVEPSNVAIAYASCTDCQTIAVALQINLISRTATYVAPENFAIAVNYECTNCYTVARAIQYTFSVDDPTQVPPEVDALIKQFDKELKAIRKEQNLSIDEVEQRINAVIEEFRDLAESLRDDREETLEATTPGATPIADDVTPTVEASHTTTATPDSQTPTVDTTPVDETPTVAVSPSVSPSETVPWSTPTTVTTATP